ncbi:hypothetical protein GYMLUDRAFT_943450 [Collybiopsis luxurians FD-317 M1]|uniref:NACHT domain-containing protein n=1 Tax=Collybiopsis luxurians FD-317 M1 TaxID=944289 RepID=A0A0D0C5S9_9AGAR|nr:hypothetical protein GYMLUDRAFT_943450 [Collybiopsis luxurians FD-317 M1]
MSGSMFSNAHDFTIYGGQFTVATRDEVRDIRDWLQAPDCSANRADAAHKKAEGTGQWILSHPEYRKWKGQPSILWIQGKVGSGKTVLSTTIWKDLSSMDTNAFWYHYFDIRDNTGNKSTYCGFLLSLVSQMGLENEGINPDLCKLYKKLKGDRKPAIKELEEILKVIIVQRNGGYLLVDGMDECAEEASKVMAWLCQFSQKLWIVVTSRNSVDVGVEQSALKIILGNEPLHTEVDIERYIQSKILSAEYNFDSKEIYWKQVVETLKNGADGQFWWVECQLKEVKDCVDADEVEEVLMNLPRDLEDIYSQAMQKAERGKQAKDAHHLLLWLLYAYEPLNVFQVIDIIAINVWKQTVKKNKGMKLRLNAIVDSSLVVIGNDNVVQFAHASVKEFLIRYNMWTQVKNVFDINKLLADDMIAQACIIYIMHVADGEEKKDRLEKFPLWNYVCQYWLVHARCIEGKKQGGPLESLTKDILMDSCNGFLLWREQYEEQWNWWREWEMGTALYYAAENGLTKRVEDILMEKRKAHYENNGLQSDELLYINSKCGRWGNALLVAVLEKGNEAVVKLLLENGADVNAQGGEYKNALQAAVEKGNEAVVKLLLENGTDVDAKGSGYGNALEAAAQRGNEAVVRLLLAYGANVNA